MSVKKTIEANVPAQGTAGTAQSTVVARAPLTGKVSAASLAPVAALATDGTNNRTFSLINKGQLGSGSTVVATYQSNVAGGALTAFKEKAMTLSATPANLNVVKGDILALVETTAGSGVAHSGHRAIVEFSRS